MKLGRRPAGVALVAGRAVGSRCDVVDAQAGGFGAVMTADAVGGTVKSAVIGLGT